MNAELIQVAPEFFNDIAALDNFSTVQDAGGDPFFNSETVSQLDDLIVPGNHEKVKKIIEIGVQDKPEHFRHSLRKVIS